jgi:hypothetical protein
MTGKQCRVTEMLPYRMKDGRKKMQCRITEVVESSEDDADSPRGSLATIESESHAECDSDRGSTIDTGTTQPVRDKGSAPPSGMQAAQSFMEKVKEKPWWGRFTKEQDQQGLRQLGSAVETRQSRLFAGWRGSQVPAPSPAVRASQPSKAVLDERGSYVIMAEATVTTDIDRTSAEVATLDPGACVEVSEVMTIQEQKRIRAKIRSPHGWISLQDTDTGFRWAKSAKAATPSAEKRPSESSRGWRRPFSSLLQRRARPSTAEPSGGVGGLASGSQSASASAPQRLEQVREDQEEPEDVRSVDKVYSLNDGESLIGSTHDTENSGCLTRNALPVDEIDKESHAKGGRESLSGSQISLAARMAARQARAKAAAAKKAKSGEDPFLTKFLYKDEEPPKPSSTIEVGEGPACTPAFGVDDEPDDQHRGLGERRDTVDV